MSKRKRFSKRPPDGLFGANASWIHGGCGTPEYIAYTTAKTLCTNPKNQRWAQYGGRGIEFRFSSFTSFLEHLGRRPAGKVLDRPNREGHFEIGNVRWATRRQSARNRKPYRKAPRATTCGHPKHHAGGLCRSCYEATPKIRARRAAYDAAHYVPTPRRITVRINSCHPDLPHYAFGLCAACYRFSPQGRAVKRRYAASPRGKKSRALYAASPRNRARQNAYAAAHYVPRPSRDVDTVRAMQSQYPTTPSHTVEADQPKNSSSVTRL
jgi:hypothetical protein